MQDVPHAGATGSAERPCKSSGGHGGRGLTWVCVAKDAPCAMS